MGWILPLLLMQKAGPLLVGVSFALANIEDTVLAFIGGPLADRYGRKPLVILSTLIYVLGSLFLLLSLLQHGFLGQALAFLATMCLYGLTGISSGPGSAIVAESVEDKNMGKSFALLTTSSLIAKALGSSILGLVYKENPIAMGFIILALALIATVPCLFLRETLQPTHAREPLPVGTPLQTTIRAIRSLGTNFILVAALVVCNGLAHGISGNYYAPYLEDVLDIDEAVIGIVYSVMTLLQSILLPLAGWIVDRYGSSAALLLGNVVSGVFVLLFSVSLSSSIAIPAMLVSAGLGVFHGVGYSVTIARLSERSFRATLYGGLEAVWNAMFILGPIIGSALYLARPALTFTVASLLLLLSVVSITRLHFRR